LQPKTAIIVSHNRPIYLWATLDALWRATKSDVQFTLIDQASTDPLVHQVIDSFAKRGLLRETIMSETNDPAMLQRLLAARFAELSDIFFYIENDAVIYEGEQCWTDRMLAFMQAEPRLAMLGSAIDKADFVPRSQIEGILGREASREELDAIKWFSPERQLPDIGPDETASPFNPPGRLLALRKQALIGCPSMRDAAMHAYLCGQGWTTAITGAVRHRHLSLYNFFDYPAYDMKNRDQFMDVAPVNSDASAV
jgi:hypothetical protein